MAEFFQSFGTFQNNLFHVCEHKCSIEAVPISLDISNVSDLVLFGNIAQLGGC